MGVLQDQAECAGLVGGESEARLKYKQQELSQVAKNETSLSPPVKLGFISLRFPSSQKVTRGFKQLLCF